MTHRGPQVLLLLVGHRQSLTRAGRQLCVTGKGWSSAPQLNSVLFFFFLVRSVQPALCAYIPYSRMYLEQIESRPPSVRKEQAESFIQTFT